MIFNDYRRMFYYTLDEFRKDLFHLVLRNNRNRFSVYCDYCICVNYPLPKDSSKVINKEADDLYGLCLMVNNLDIEETTKIKDICDFIKVKEEYLIKELLDFYSFICYNSKSRIPRRFIKRLNRLTNYYEATFK